MRGVKVVCAGLLQVGRFAAGMTAIWQFLGLMPAVVWVMRPEAATGEAVGAALVKAVVFCVAVVAYRVLTRAVNALRGRQSFDGSSTAAAVPTENLSATMVVTTRSRSGVVWGAALAALTVGLGAGWVLRGSEERKQTASSTSASERAAEGADVIRVPAYTPGPVAPPEAASSDEHVKRARSEAVAALSYPGMGEKSDELPPGFVLDQSPQARWSPTGQPWPINAGYIDSLPHRATSGLSTLTIDNRQNGADVYVKLCAASADRCHGIRHVFVPAGASFLIKRITPGSYDVRYRSLDTGVLSKSEPIDLVQTSSDRGIQYSNARLTLYKVSGGNTTFERLSEDKF
jgi:hypothetical protein